MTDRDQIALSLDAWLGDARAGLTDDQHARLLAERVDLAERYPDDEDGDEDLVAALSAATQYILGEITPDAAGNVLIHHRREAADAMAAAQQVARMAVQDGMGEVEAASRCQIARMTVRKALGKG